MTPGADPKQPLKEAGAKPAGPVLRFAPSPNGPLHLGHAFSAITGYEMAQRLGGMFLVRIEDIDMVRARPELIAAIFDDLTWLGLRWELPVLHQSRHLADYRAAADRLQALGLLYPCFATRKDIVAAASHTLLDPEGALVYPGIWRARDGHAVVERMGLGEPFALRLDMGRAIGMAKQKLQGRPLAFTEMDNGGRMRTVVCAPERWGDVIILRKETPSSYLIAVVVDDARQGVTHVTRGMDLYPATDAQRLLQVLLDLPEPIYHHHRLIADAGGLKLSKSKGAQSLAEMRAAGATPGDIRRMAGLSA
ncbi:MAG: tRNA glutamyl-Q(34) synthetase GluQRS [Hyphomicrobium sp.]